MIPKMISVEKKHVEWVKKNHINLSSLVRSVINEKMNE